MKTFNYTFGIALLATSIVLSACGGGGSGTSTSNSGIPWSATPDWPVTPAPSSSSQDNSDNGSTGNSGSPNASNSVPITVDTSMMAVNQPAVTITLCPAGAPASSSQCVTVSNMLVDTGSVGVRVLNSALSSSLKASLLTQVGATDDKIGSAPIVECAMFASGYVWGPIKRANVSIGGNTAGNIPIQIIGDGSFTTPDDCSTRGGMDLGTTVLGTIGKHTFNGIVGIGNFTNDAPVVAKQVVPGTYYYCSSPNACSATRVPLAKQVVNPVSAFPANYNNGTVITLPALPTGGQTGVAGQLIFGVGTRPNNALPTNPTIIQLDSDGFFTTQYRGRAILNSAIDSGTNTYAFSDTSLPITGDWYTPPGGRSLSASMEATNGSGLPATIQFSLGNATSVMSNGYAAYDNLGTYLDSLPVYDVKSGAMQSEEGFLWGLPFFYGRSVYTVLENATVGTQSGPFVAF